MESTAMQRHLILLGALALLALAAPPYGSAQSSIQGSLHVLFVGNSLTDHNGMPQTVAGLAKTAPRALYVQPELDCPHGVITFETHWKSGQVKTMVEKGGHWDWAVFNENSAVPSFPMGELRREMYPYGHQFHDYLKGRGVKMLLVMTWGFKDGDRANNPNDTFDAMGDRLQRGYEGLADELHVPIAPVGLAWKQVRRERPDLNLYEDDHHPSAMGSYLMACVVYRVLVPGSHVAGNGFYAGLPADVAAYLQKVADQTVDAYPRARTSP
ncbi:MAG TPA: hypothetical protein VGO93_30295 [Candidatus Xenobia bacterium]|jgi:hypothetical protein